MGKILDVLPKVDMFAFLISDFQLLFWANHPLSWHWRHRQRGGSAGPTGDPLPEAWQRWWRDRGHHVCAQRRSSAGYLSLWSYGDGGSPVITFSAFSTILIMFSWRWLKMLICFWIRYTHTTSFMKYLISFRLCHFLSLLSDTRKLQLSFVHFESVDLTIFIFNNNKMCCLGNKTLVQLRLDSSRTEDVCLSNN